MYILIYTVHIYIYIIGYYTHIFHGDHFKYSSNFRQAVRGHRSAGWSRPVAQRRNRESARWFCQQKLGLNQEHMLTLYLILIDQNLGRWTSICKLLWSSPDDDDDDDDDDVYFHKSHVRFLKCVRAILTSLRCIGLVAGDPVGAVFTERMPKLPPNLVVYVHVWLNYTIPHPNHGLDVPLKLYLSTYFDLLWPSKCRKCPVRPRFVGEFLERNRTTLWRIISSSRAACNGNFKIQWKKTTSADSTILRQINDVVITTAYCSSSSS